MKRKAIYFQKRNMFPLAKTMLKAGSLTCGA